MDGFGDDENAIFQIGSAVRIRLDDGIRVKIGFYDRSVEFCFHFGL